MRLSSLYTVTAGLLLQLLEQPPPVAKHQPTMQDDTPRGVMPPIWPSQQRSNNQTSENLDAVAQEKPCSVSQSDLEGKIVWHGSSWARAIRAEAAQQTQHNHRWSAPTMESTSCCCWQGYRQVHMCACLLDRRPAGGVMDMETTNGKCSAAAPAGCSW